MKPTLQKLSLIFAVCLLQNAICFAQINLVLNPSFEQHTACPTGQDQVPYSTGWENLAITPDYYNACATLASQQSVPYNIYGSYQPAATGSAYCGFYTTYHMGSYGHNFGNAREIIGRQLSAPMVIGAKYYASIKVSLAYNGATTSANCATNNIGIKFCVYPPISYADSIYVASPLINNFAHIYETAIITDTVNWTTISGSIIADSAYDYILISNFFDSAHTDTMLIDPLRIFCRAYYYLDDVCVSSDSITCGIIDNINTFDIQNSVIIYPNPFSTFTTITLTEDFFRSDKYINLILYDTKGIIIKTEQVNDRTIQFDAGNLSKGIYILQIQTSKQIINKKLIITN